MSIRWLIGGAAWLVLSGPIGHETAGAQTEPAEVGAATDVVQPFNVGDPAPRIRIMSWLKGEPIESFREDHVYAIEFWATWCGPCIEGIPHLSEVQDRFAASATLVSVTRSDPANTLEAVERFLEQRGDEMRYRIAFDELDFTWRAYMEGAGQTGIPCAFLIDKKGRLAWVGHPADPAFEETIAALVDDSFDMERARLAWIERRAELNERRAEREQTDELVRSLHAAWDSGERERALEIADDLVAIDPESMFSWAWWKFEALLVGLGDDRRAYEFVEQAAATYYDESPEMLLRFVYGIADSIGVDDPDLDLALRLAERALELTNREEPRSLSAVAMVQMRRKHYDEAIVAMRRAIELATTPEMRASLENELEWYELERQMAARRGGG